jgi:ABC-type transporter Mla subunit MlaD
VTCLVGAVVAFIALGSARRSSVQGLEVTEAALVTLRDTVELADDLVGSVQQGLAVVEDTLGEVATTVANADEVLVQVERLAGALPASVASARSTLQSLSSVAAVVDQTLAAASSVPFIPDYRPPRPLADVVSQLDTDLAPIEQALTDLDANLDGLTDASAGVSPGLTELVDQLGQVNRELARADSLVEEYLATADRAALVVTDARNDLDRDLTALRWLALPAGLALALTQLVPIWLGGGLLGRWPAPIVGRVPVSASETVR